MKKITVFFLLVLLIQTHEVQAADWMVNVSSNKGIYEFQEEAVFDIEIMKNGALSDIKGAICTASFPTPDTAVSLLNIEKGKYRYNVVLNSLLENQTLNVNLIKKGKKEAVLAEGSKTVNVIICYENSFTITEGSYTNNNEITLEIDSNASYELAISEDSMFTDIQWQPYAAIVPFILSEGDEEKTVYVKFRHNVTQEEQVENTRIVLDTIAPTITSLSPIEGAVVTGK